MRTRTVVLAATLSLATRAAAAEPKVDGEYDTPLGRVAVSASGPGFIGRVVEPSGPCRFGIGEEIFRGTLLDDSLAGQLRVCLQGTGCAADAWAGAVLLVAPGGLSGAVHLAAKGCSAPMVGRNGGVAFIRAAKRSPGRGAGGRDGAAPVPPAERREKARALLRDGAAWLSEGNFEKARARFRQAIEQDPRVPEAYNGVGVTYRMRNDLAAALGWYKKALAIDPDFGDAYYNMACVYALRGEKELALRYLQIAAMNGYATAEGMDQDPDLAPVRSEPAYRALVRQKM